MRFAVICLKRNNICTVVADGDYSELSDILDILKGQDIERDLSLIEMDENEYNEVKNDAVALNNKLSQYYFSEGDSDTEFSDFEFN